MTQIEAATIVQAAWTEAGRKGMTEAQYIKAKKCINTTVLKFTQLPASDRKIIYGPLRRIYPDFPIAQEVIDLAIGT